MPVTKEMTKAISKPVYARSLACPNMIYPQRFLRLGF
ncbi:MAG: hypothetical protein U5K54_27510 [Cytophagales bacterium]|nr:hypothetical protein [Cytophagales bacterium]